MISQTQGKQPHRSNSHKNICKWFESSKSKIMLLGRENLGDKDASKLLQGKTVAKIFTVSRKPLIPVYYIFLFIFIFSPLIFCLFLKLILYKIKSNFNYFAETSINNLNH
jgi:hypothetical protein